VYEATHGGSLFSRDDEIEWKAIASLTAKSYVTCIAVIARRLAVVSVQLIDHLIEPSDAFTARQALELECSDSDRVRECAPMLAR